MTVISTFVRLGCILTFALSPLTLHAHGSAHPVRYVAANGVDTGTCATPATPCATISYAVNQATKGDKVLVASGEYHAREMDIFFLLSDMVEVQGGYSTRDQFTMRDTDKNEAIITGIPEHYRERLASRGFRLIRDAKASAAPADENRFLARYEKITAAVQGPATCSDGMADEFPCANIDLLSHMPLGAFSSVYSSANDIWGFVDLNDNREYALIGLRGGVAVVDVTDPGNPSEVGLIKGVGSTWRDIKVYQFFDSASGDYKAYAYVTTEGSSGGLQIIDLTGLPASVSLANTITEFFRAHNVYLANIDYATGMALDGMEPFLYIAGANKDGGLYRVFNLIDPINPQLVATNPLGGYMHDATSLVITDSRTAQCHNGHNPCELLISFSGSTVKIWDMTDKSNPVRLSRTNYTNASYSHSGWWSADKMRLFLQDELDEKNLGLNTTLNVLDISNLLDPVLSGKYTGSTQAVDHNGFTRGNRYYMSNYRRGLVVLDVSDPDKPTELGFFDTFPIPEENTATFNGAWGAYPFLPSGNILVSDIDYGLYVVKDRGTASAVVAAFSYSCVLLDCNFDAGGSIGSVTGFDWTFGDGDSASGVSQSHSYDDGGSYTVKLTVTGAGGATDSVSRLVTVSPEPAPISLSYKLVEKNGNTHIDLFWDGVTGDRADIWSNGEIIRNTANDGNFRMFRVEDGSYDIKVCNETSTTGCSNSISVQIGDGSPPPPPPPSGDLTLIAEVVRKNGYTHVYLYWEGANGDRVDIYQDDNKIRNTANDGKFQVYRVIPASYRYQVCEENSTSVCSPEIIVDAN